MQRRRRITKLFKEFFESEKSAGFVLIFCTIISLYISNSESGPSYMGFWHHKILSLSIEHWVNDGLMAIFFLLIGLELVREVTAGELSNLKEAMLPIFGALGGMIVPAALYLSINFGMPSQSGAGIPMATDIAFAIGILSLLGNRIPMALKVFLTALAVIDDLGAIIIIAIFYTRDLAWDYILYSILILSVLFVFNRKRVQNLIPYILGGIILWYCMLKSGIHASISGVLIAMLIPFGDGTEKSNSYKLQKFLHIPVAYYIIPIFALANTAFIIEPISGNFLNYLAPLGIIIGLVIGKPLGIFLFSYIAIKKGWSRLPRDVNWSLIIGTGFLGGIGFTMSIFIALLAFNDIHLINQAKFAILISSFIAGLTGFLLLFKSSLKKNL